MHMINYNIKKIIRKTFLSHSITHKVRKIDKEVKHRYKIKKIDDREIDERKIEITFHYT